MAESRDFVHIDIGGATPQTQHVLMIDDDTTPAQLRSAAEVAVENARPVAANLLRQLADARQGRCP